ncbi:MAG TPA: alanine racemase [Bacteroidales bacterium]|nr:alanine racemase [Bacteroidales bacterium]HPR57269.1 alanine racemase [Bacteroidales bacterium]HRW96174.1 alanine racemase [Bacteroidales bacterium]
MHSTSTIEISRSALRHNVRFLQSFLHPGVRISSVVKANAYGHGIDPFVGIAEECGIDHFSVFSLDEAYQVKKALKNHAEIMVMGWSNPKDIDWAVENGIELYVFENEILETALTAAKKSGKNAVIHLEIETGMNRTGLVDKDLRKAVAKIKANKEYFRVKGLCTHYSGAESISNYHRIQHQIRRFRQKQRLLLKAGILPEQFHTACSAASIAYPGTQMDMVRIGILQYGLWPSPETFIHFTHQQNDRTDPLKRVLSWKSSIMSIKEVKEGEFVSYGTNYLAKTDMLVAIIPTGYSHGYSRSLSNQGRVLIKGQRAGIIGLVNMNMMIADITGIDDVKIGDEVVFIGKQGDRVISVSSFTEFSDQLNYELLARLPQNIPRKIVD